MKREININDITKDKLMVSSDMAKVGSNECMGCHKCCCDMGNSIILDPYDIMNLYKATGCDFPALLSNRITLNIVDGVILPNISMTANKTFNDKSFGINCCNFLNEDGRCDIHEYRPGICRLFPLGRIYEDGTFNYFLQSDQCAKENRTKVKIRNFLDIDNLKAYEEFVTKWHYFLNYVEECIKKMSGMENSDIKIKNINMYILNTFFITKTGEDEFFEEMNRRILIAKKKIELEM